MKKSPPTKNSLNIVTSETSSVSDKLGTHKPWFNGMKHFWTVKVLPVQKNKGD